MKVVIIGAGFSGTVTAVNLLRGAGGKPLQVVLVNQSGRIARGIAYGTRSPAHVLNVPAGNMSALSDDPEDFLRFCRWSDPAVEASSFVPRRLYGSYLEALLTAAEHRGNDHAMLERITDEVLSVRVAEDGAGATVQLARGGCMLADQVVLAFGHFAPRDPPVRSSGFFASRRYIRDPWAPGALEAVRPNQPVLLLGTGLTAVDVALSLQAHEDVSVLCLSRRGLTPQGHRPATTHAVPVDVTGLLDRMGTTVRSYLRALRGEVRQRAREGHDWRDVISALRPHTPALWQRLTAAERRRFLRHVQPHWDVLRHRCAPQSLARWDDRRAEGRVEVAAGRVLAFVEDAAGVTVTWRPRGSAAVRTSRFQCVVNCTGPGADICQASSPLVRDLIAGGLVRPDPFGLGIDVDTDYVVLDAQGRPSPVVRYVGPLLKARDWEATAVPELRAHAAALARRIGRQR